MKKIVISLATLCFVAAICAQLAFAQKVDNVAGNWQATVKMPTATVNQQWTIQQKEDTLTGTVKTDKGDLTFTGSVDDSGFFRADIKDGTMVDKVRGSLNKDKVSIDGSITIGNKEYLWAAKRSQ